MNPNRDWLLVSSLLFALQVHVSVIEVEVLFCNFGFDGRGGRTDGFVLWNAMFGFVGDSTWRWPVFEEDL